MNDWVPVELGDVRVGDTVRTIPSQITEKSPYREIEGQITGIRNGMIMVSYQQDWIMFQASQLERAWRPE